MTISGSDSCGGAGMQADLKTFAAMGVYGASVVTLITAQNTRGVDAFHGFPASWIREQYDSNVADLNIAAIKTGSLGTAEAVEAVADALSTSQCPLVVDPVMISKHGHSILQPDAVEVLQQRLIPQATLLTPNQLEAEALSQQKIESPKDLPIAAEALLDLGCQAVLIKAHFDDQNHDHFAARSDGSIQAETFTSDRLATSATHGSGCVLSAAITAGLASGQPLRAAVIAARQFVAKAIATAPTIGGGLHPLQLLTTS